MSDNAAGESCPNHPDQPRLGYMQACADADRRIKRHEQQWQCGRCGKWVWHEFMVDMTGAISEGWFKRQCREQDKKARKYG